MAAAAVHPSAVPAPSEGDGQVLLDDTSDPLCKEDLVQSDQFCMYCLKVLPCSKRYCHDWTTCPFAHPGEKAKRRDPRIYTYTGVACPEMKKNNHCPAGDKCVYAHSVWEYWLHSSRYRTQLCNDGVSCKRKICFFAHTLEELRISSVKVLNPESAHLGEDFELDPFAPSAPLNGTNTQQGGGRQGGLSQRKGGHHGNRHQLVRHGMANGSHFSNGSGMGGGPQVPGFNVADLQQLTQLQAKLQVAAGMGSLGALPAQLMQQQQQQHMGELGPGMMPGSMADLVATEHLMHQLMQQQHPLHHQQLQQQADVMQIMAGALTSQQQQQAAAAMAAAAHGRQAGHAPAAVAAAASHMQVLQNEGMPAPPCSMEAQQQQQQQQRRQQLAGTGAGSLKAGVMGMHGGLLAQQQQQQQRQHAATLAGVGGLRGLAHHPNGLDGSITGPGALRKGPLNMHSVGRDSRRGSSSSSGRPGLGTSATPAHHAPAFGAGLPHDQQHTAPGALLTQQFAGLGVNGGLGGVVPFPHFPLAPSNGPPGMASSLYSSSSGFSGAGAGAAHGTFGVSPTFRRHHSLPPPRAMRVPIAQGAGRSTSLQHPAHLHIQQQQQQQQQHGGGDTPLAAHSLPTQAFRQDSSGKHTPMLDPGTGSLVPSNSIVAMPSAAVLQNAASAPTQMPWPGSSGAAAGASPFFGSNSLSRAGSTGHVAHVENVTYAEEAAPSP